MTIVRKTLAAATLAAMALGASSPAMAEHRDGRGGDTAAIAIGAGLVGIAVGAIIASNKRDRWDDRYYVRDGWYYNDGYYYNRSGYRYDRRDWERRYGYDRHRRSHRHDWDRGRRSDGWNRDHDWDRGHNWGRDDHRRGGGGYYYGGRGY